MELSEMIQTQYLQGIDSALLLGIPASSIIIMQRDFKEAPIILKVCLGIFATSYYWQAMFLLGQWEPGPSGFPLSRLACDGSLFAMCFARVLIPMTMARIDKSIAKSVISRVMQSA